MAGVCAAYVGSLVCISESLCWCWCVQLKKLMVQTNIGEDYSVDPVVQEACDPVVRSGCPHVRAGDRRFVHRHTDIMHTGKTS